MGGGCRVIVGIASCRHRQLQGHGVGHRHGLEGGQGIPYGLRLRAMHRVHWLRHMHNVMHGRWLWIRQWHRLGSTRIGCTRHGHGHRCRRVMADRARAQIQAKARGMTVSQGQVVAQGYKVAQARMSMHMEGVSARVEAMVAEQGGWGWLRCGALWGGWRTMWGWTVL